MDIYSNCSWEKGKCLNMGLGNLSSQTWWDYYKPCINYPLSKAVMDEYCGKDTFTIPATFGLQNVEGGYGVPNLYCRWVLNNTDLSKNLSFNFTNMSNQTKSVFQMVMYYKSGKRDVRWGGLESFSWSLDEELKSMEIHYFDSITYNSNPFIISVDYNNESILNYFSWICILLSSICLVCFVCALSCPNASNRNNNASNVHGIEANRRKTNRKILDKLFTTALVPVVYSEKTNVYKNDCTICLEDFNPNSKVVVLECKHIFHFECLKEWLIKNILHPKCPNCNYDVVFRIVDEQHNHYQRPVTNINNVSNLVNVIQNNTDGSYSNRVLNTTNDQPSSKVNIN